MDDARARLAAMAAERQKSTEAAWAILEREAQRSQQQTGQGGPERGTGFRIVINPGQGETHYDRVVGTTTATIDGKEQVVEIREQGGRT